MINFLRVIHLTEIQIDHHALRFTWRSRGTWLENAGIFGGATQQKTESPKNECRQGILEGHPRHQSTQRRELGDPVQIHLQCYYHGTGGVQDDLLSMCAMQR